MKMYIVYLSWPTVRRRSDEFKLLVAGGPREPSEALMCGDWRAGKLKANGEWVTPRQRVEPLAGDEPLARRRLSSRSVVAALRSRWLGSHYSVPRGSSLARRG